MNIQVYYAHYWQGRATHKARPKWFSPLTCIRSFFESIDDLVKIDFNFIFDGTLEQMLEDDCYSYLKNIKNDNVEINFYTIDAGSQRNSSEFIFNLINGTQTSEDSFVYLLENDYLHIKGWVMALNELALSGIRFDYVSLYDHPDKYEHTPEFWEKYKHLKSKVFHTDNVYWRTIPSTCMSFIVKKKIFKSDMRLFLFLRDVFVFPVLRLLKGRILLCPIPGYATHSMTNFLGPVVKWHKEVNDAQK